MKNSRLSDFLLEQFEAISEFERGIYCHQSVDSLTKTYRVHPHQAKNWYINPDFSHLLEDKPWVRDLCQELEKVVPLDHPYWTTQPAIQ